MADLMERHSMKRLTTIGLVCLLAASCKSDSKDDVPLDGGATVDAGVITKGPVALGSKPALGEKCMGKTKPGVKGKVPSFKKEVIAMQPGGGYIKAVDLNKDDYPEILLTTLTEGIDLTAGIPPISSGGGYVISRKGGKGEGIGTWETKKVFDRDTRIKVDGMDVPINWPNASDLVDINNDGMKDWVIGAGFLTKPTGMIVWMKGSEKGTFSGPKNIDVPDTTCWYHETLPIDMDDDGDEDFVTSCRVGRTGEPNAVSRMEWFENPGDGTDDFKHHAIGEGGGTLMSLHDLDGDGDQDVVAAEYFGPDSLVWFEQTGKKGSKWARHTINDTTGHGFMTRIGDINGDGKLDIVYCNHNNQMATEKEDQIMGIYWFEIPPADKLKSLKNWDKYIHTIHEGFMVAGMDNANSAGAPGSMNIGDVDGDCDLDVTISGDGDAGLYLFIQQDKGFEKVDIDLGEHNLNSGEQHVFDLDGDGDHDILWTVFGKQATPENPDIKSFVAAFLQE